VAYQLSLLENLSAVYDVFHVSQLNKCLRVPEEQLLAEHLEVQEDLTYIEKQLKFWRQQIGSPGEVPSGCANSNRVTTQKKKPPGKEKMI
jgi:hypothetical protein